MGTGISTVIAHCRDVDATSPPRAGPAIPRMLPLDRIRLHECQLQYLSLRETLLILPFASQISPIL